MGFMERVVGRIKSIAPTLYPVDSRGGGWFSLFGGSTQEAYTGAWQQNVVYKDDQLLAFFAVFACITRIAQDVSKLCFNLRQFDPVAGIYTNTSSAAFSPVLLKPNAYQNHIQFKETWLLSKLYRGNTYVLKQRDARGLVTALMPLHPDRVMPLVTSSGEIYYRLNPDNLSQIDEGGVIIPASEIIHDRMNTLFHPLVGISPLFASVCAATNGLTIQENSAKFFANGSTPGGLITFPGELEQADADEIKATWSDKFSGKNSGKIGVLSGGATFQQMRMTAIDSQLIEQLKMSGEVVCSCFHVPPYKVGIGLMPTHANIEALGIQYYQECLQAHIEGMEACLDDALGIGLANNSKYDVALDIDNLSRMDSASQATAEAELVKAGIKKPNESRQRFNLPPVKGGDAPYMQQQQYSLEALAARDADKPFAKPAAAQAPAVTATTAANDEQVGADQARTMLRDHLTKRAGK